MYNKVGLSKSIVYPFKNVKTRYSFFQQTSPAIQSMSQQNVQRVHLDVISIHPSF